MTIHKSKVTAIMIELMVIAAFIATLGTLPAWGGKAQGAGLTALSAVEAVELAYMREEEKLAHDVYLVMYDNWGVAIFTRIATSEQQHMDTMKKMLDKYNLLDPAKADAGLFTDPDLQAKYDMLVANGSRSYVGGLYAGATIEEIDMIDIQHAIDLTSHVDVVNAYQNLLEGSKSHLRAFVNALAAQGVTYDPQFISQELFDAIMEL